MGCRIVVAQSGNVDATPPHFQHAPSRPELDGVGRVADAAHTMQLILLDVAAYRLSPGHSIIPLPSTERAAILAVVASIGGGLVHVFRVKHK